MSKMEIAQKRGTSQTYATSPSFWTNLHFGQFVKCVNHQLWLKHLTNCPKWRFVRNNYARSRKIASKCPHNVAQARGPKIRPKLGVSCRRLNNAEIRGRQSPFPEDSPRNPRFPIYRLCLQTTFPADALLFFRAFVYL
jgi:hypothetical protein